MSDAQSVFRDGRVMCIQKSKTCARKLRNTGAQPKNQTRMVHYFVTLAEIVYTWMIKVIYTRDYTLQSPTLTKLLARKS